MAGDSPQESAAVRSPPTGLPYDEEGADEETQTADTTSRKGRSPSEEGEERDDDPPLPDEPPPLPDEAPPEDAPQDDGWEARWDAQHNAYYFFNRFTLKSQWENPRVPEAAASYGGDRAPGTDSAPQTVNEPPPAPYQGYNPKIHGDYDPNADYAKFHEPEETEESQDAGAATATDGTYTQSGTFNRFTGAFQNQARGADYHNDENKSNRQMSAFFDVEKAANAHQGRSLKEERSKRKLSKKEVKEFNEKRKAKKEQKRREFLMS
ncbi:hypothetical protein K461DRAFT_142095 [Myriangium duriaei CBS 260.36]|uniref:WW domain-containing protein n=1 Tax=Myriangium duriaei CBS 260.36 TaxID=1168546 RepID=A0A9P4J506_9PEZI|nr:hypothetical protein K461DRAFT_142095 [Myriangium duriaei CBS 260.36]